MKTQNDKRITILVALTMLLCLLLPTAMQAQDYTYTTNNNTIIITGYTGAGGAVVIPDAITGLPVISLGNEAFRSCTNLTSIMIPDSVTSIGDYVFYNCANLTNAIIGASVTKIGRRTFEQCTSLVNVIIGANVTDIDNDAFDSCSSLTGVCFQGNAPDHGSSVFSLVKAAKAYYLPVATGFGKGFSSLLTALWGGPTVVTNAITSVGGIPIVQAGTAVEFNAPWLGPSWRATNCARDFGGGSTSTNFSLTHVFTNCQVYTVSYRGSDGGAQR